MNKHGAQASDVRHFLTEFFQQHLPITDHLKMRPLDYNADEFSLAIDLAPSINDKLTAFGGSLYCLTVMNCWGMVYLQGRQRGIDPNLVVSHGEIDYLAPVADEIIVSRCVSPVDCDWDEFYREVAAGGRSKISLQSEIYSGGRLAVRFSGRYAVIGLK